MKEIIKICYEGAIAEIIEKKSRFIANIKNVNTEDEALEFIQKMKKKYSDARHNCYAYVVGEEIKLYKYSDDGEPQGTAGRPMLDILINENISNICVVVTRYFGGILLGTGGLVRAYSSALKEALSLSKILESYIGESFEYEIDYNLFGKIKYFIEEKKYIISYTSYDLNVKIGIIVPEEEVDIFLNKLTDLSLGKLEYTSRKKIRYLLDDKKAIIME